MMVLIVERVRPSVRGELTRWLLEPKAGVFVGSVSARVREKLWQKVCSKTGDGAAMLIWTSNTEQGYRIDFWGHQPPRLRLGGTSAHHTCKMTNKIHVISPRPWG